LAGIRSIASGRSVVAGCDRWEREMPFRNVHELTKPSYSKYRATANPQSN
jgi:hypothetical protein